MSQLSILDVKVNVTRPGSGAGGGESPATAVLGAAKIGAMKLGEA